MLGVGRFCAPFQSLLQAGSFALARCTRGALEQGSAWGTVAEKLPGGKGPGGAG